MNKSFSSEKRIFLVSVNSFSLDAQNVLLKMFEEPVPDTHFFLVVPDANALLKTLVSRFYLISPTPGVGVGITEAEDFIAMSVKNRFDFIKELLTGAEDFPAVAGEEATVAQDSTRSKAIKFLNALEALLHSNFPKNKDCFQHIFKVREFLRMPGSSTKSLMESVALIVPNF